MRTVLQKLVFACLLLGAVAFNAQSAKACDRSRLTLDSITPGPSGTYYIYLRLCVGAGVFGLLKGADGNTGRFLFSFSSSTPGFAVTSFTNPIRSDFTGMNYAGVNVGSQPAFNATQAIFYNNSSNWFACITSTVACGNVNTECDQIRFQVTSIPDSIRIYGIEGGDNLFGGCYPNISMLIDFTGLPVEWQDFTARQENGGVALDWVTMNETNNNGFEVLRSQDGNQFSAIGTMAANSVNKIGQYKFFDPHPLPGTNYYRIRQVDINGGYSESETRSLSYAPESGVSWNNVYPNPATSRVNVEFRTGITEKVSLELMDIQGRTLQSFSIPAEQGLNAVEMNTSSFAPGLYFLRLRHSGGILEKKLVLM